MKTLKVQVTATLTLDPAEAEKILDALAARIVGALPALKESGPPAPSEPAAKRAADFLSTAQLARRWQMHAESVRRMIREKRLPAVRIGRRLRVSLAAVERLEG